MGAVALMPQKPPNFPGFFQVYYVATPAYSRIPLPDFNFQSNKKFFRDYFSMLGLEHASDSLPLETLRRPNSSLDPSPFTFFTFPLTFSNWRGWGIETT